MKKVLFIALLAIFSPLAFGQSSSLEQAIGDALIMLDSAGSVSDMQDVTNRLQRISSAEPERWEPLYHLAFAQIMMCFRETDAEARDKILDLAEANITAALKLKGDPSELHALQGFLYQGRIQVNASRGMIFSQKAAAILEQAMSENPQNPRALFLMGQNIYFTPKAFGGGCEKALPDFLKAKDLFEGENGKRGLNPGWGAKSNLKAIEDCHNEN